MALALVLAAAPAPAAAETIGRSAVTAGCADRAFGGAGAFAPFGRALPPRGPSRCSMPRAPVSVAAGDGVIAVAESPSCQGIARTAASGRGPDGLAAGLRSRIVLHRGAEAVDVQADGRVAIVRGGCVWLGRRRLARGRFAGFDLAPDRAVWAVGRPGGFQRIVLERL
jgi:hypothetical protein